MEMWRAQMQVNGKQGLQQVSFYFRKVCCTSGYQKISSWGTDKYIGKQNVETQQYQMNWGKKERQE